MPYRRLPAWADRSFLIELKPLSDQAALYIDCPNSDPHKREICSSDGIGSGVNILNQPATVEVNKAAIKIKKHEIIMIENGLDENDPEDGGVISATYHAVVDGLVLYPETLCAMNWVDHQRLLTCKLRVFITEPKTFLRMGNEIISASSLEEFVANAKGQSFKVECSCCHQRLLSSSEMKLTLLSVPSDEWLETFTSLEYFCRGCCSHSQPSSICKSDAVLSDDSFVDWKPNPERVILSFSHIFVNEESVVKNSVIHDDSQDNLRCSKCTRELGRIVKQYPNLYQLHNAMTSLRIGDNEDYLPSKFGSIERYLTWMLLSHCESQTSLKLVVRTYNKRPYLLVWLLESYVILIAGALKKIENGVDTTMLDKCEFPCTPVLKVLYKVFDSETALSDPRANGEDASIGIIHAPLECCLQIIEVLLSSSEVLPPNCRTVGQFYVGFLKLNDDNN
ncbi:hypothetical protein AB6A40_005527 [Gnathostoma spinigerum]|uniref:E3 ubiquitin-protein ligase E3D n=1 Tax=Gnathostoma spinigerum TaxID=75299 RepID=A0ABD6EFQ5_9BILA